MSLKDPLMEIFMIQVPKSAFFYAKFRNIAKFLNFFVTKSMIF